MSNWQTSIGYEDNQIMTKTSKQPKNIFSIFSVFLLTFIVVLFHFLHAIYCMKVCVFASASRVAFESRKHLPACWLYLTIWPPNAQGTKGPGKQVQYVSNHVLSRTVPDFNDIARDHLAYEMVLDINVLCACVELIIHGHCNG